MLLCLLRIQKCSARTRFGWLLPAHSEAVEPPPVRAASWRLASYARHARVRVRVRVRVRGSFKDQDDLANCFSGAQPVRRLLEVGDVQPGVDDRRDVAAGDRGQNLIAKRL